VSAKKRRTFNIPVDNNIYLVGLAGDCSLCRRTAYSPESKKQARIRNNSIPVRIVASTVDPRIGSLSLEALSLRYQVGIEGSKVFLLE
jgi:hypothetical protein